MRKSSTNNCRPTSIGITAGGDTRYGGTASGSRVSAAIFGGQASGSTMPL